MTEPVIDLCTTVYDITILQDGGTMCTIYDDQPMLLVLERSMTDTSFQKRCNCTLKTRSVKLADLMSYCQSAWGKPQ